MVRIGSEFDRNEIVFDILGSILFAVTGGMQTETKKVYMIDAKTGDILTSFQSTPVKSSISAFDFENFFICIEEIQCST